MAGFIFYCILNFFPIWWTAFSMFVHYAKGKRMICKIVRIPSPVSSTLGITLEIILPYVLGATAVLLSALYTFYEHGDPYFFGSDGVENLSLRWMKMTTLSSGDTLCFVHELTFYLSILVPYVITMVTVVGVYLYLRESEKKNRTIFFKF